MESAATPGPGQAHSPQVRRTAEKQEKATQAVLW